jgi:hypothetical protein
MNNIADYLTLPPAFIMKEVGKEDCCLNSLSCPCCKNNKTKSLRYVERVTIQCFSETVRLKCFYCLKQYNVNERCITEEICKIMEKEKEAKQTEAEIELKAKKEKEKKEENQEQEKIQKEAKEEQQKIQKEAKKELDSARLQVSELHEKNTSKMTELEKSIVTFQKQVRLKYLKKGIEFYFLGSHAELPYPPYRISFKNTTDEERKEVLGELRDMGFFVSQVYLE